MTSGGRAVGPRDAAPGSRLLLGLAATAVAFAAADTYVVVLALPDMMSAVGLDIDELHRAAPIVSGFLLGYVAMLPLIGRVVDLRGRLPVLVGALAAFALGSLVTAAAYDLPSIVVGRFLQGLGGGGLVPATLALVADMYPPSRRGTPLGVVGAVQELGSVVGPLYGAAVLAVAGWREIFWLNLGVGLVLAGALLLSGRRMPAGRIRHPDVRGVTLVALAVACLALVMLAPGFLTSRVSIGLAFVPVLGGSRWLSPLALLFFALLLALGVHGWRSPRAAVSLRRWVRLADHTDVPAACLLTLSLGCVVVAFATAEPQVRLLSPAGPWLLATSGAAAAAFWWQNRHAAHPLVPPRALARPPAWGAVLASFFAGAALVAALVDIPVFARLTVYPDSQVLAALVLVRFLVAVPVGALCGGLLTRRLAAGLVTAAGAVLAALGLLAMSRWGFSSLEHAGATAPLMLTGLGFGLVLTPVNAALLAATDAAVHGLASALLVVARMVGMLVGVSALTAVGLRRYYAVQAGLPPPARVCHSETVCPAYTDLLRQAGLAELHTVFVGAAVCALLAGLVAALTFRSAPTRTVATADLLRPSG